MNNNYQQNYPTNKTILVTGGAGFIGSNITEKLLQLNNKVVCFDNFITGSKINIKPFLDNSNYNLIKGDIRNFKDCELAVIGVDYVLHQAALGSVPRSVENPVSSVESNTQGFVNILTASKNAMVKRFVYASSSSVYGDNDDNVKTENNTGKPLSPYAVTKVTNELFAENFAQVYGIETVGLRYFNVFGKNQDPNGAYAAVIPKFIQQMLKNERPIINNNDGSFSRDFTHVNNVVSANLLALTAHNDKLYNNSTKHNVFNIACGSRISLDELFMAIKNALIKECGNNNPNIANITPVYGIRRAGDIPHSLANIEKAMTFLKYKVEVPFIKGIEKTVKWYIDNITDSSS